MLLAVRWLYMLICVSDLTQRMKKCNRENQFDTVLESLSSSYRRQLLMALLHHNPQDDHDHDPMDLSSESDNEVMQSDIIHNHLPKLEELGYIEWERTTNQVKKGPNWNEIAPLLQLINNHRDELPDEWFQQ